MATGTLCKSEAEFPDPHRFAIWWHGSNFVIYRNLSLVKTAITSNCNYDDTVRWDAKVYEHTGESWELIYHLPRGANRLEHELWTNGAAPKTMAVSEESVEAAIASIMGTNKG